MSKKTQEDLQKNGFNLKRAAEVSVPGLGSASTSTEFGISTEDSKKYEESVESTKIVTIGSKLPEDGKIILLMSSYDSTQRQALTNIHVNTTHNSPQTHRAHIQEPD